MRTQGEKILEYMKKNGGITTMEATVYLHIYRLSARIRELRENHTIISETVKKKNEEGRTVTFTRYRLAK